MIWFKSLRLHSLNSTVVFDKFIFYIYEIDWNKSLVDWLIGQER